MSDKEQSAVAEPEEQVAPKPARKATAKGKKKPPRRQPRYNVILWNDDDHSHEYVIAMMKELFAHPEERGRLIAEEVDKQGRSICLTTTMEHAELKRDQIHAYGADKRNVRCKGSMSATIEPLEG